MGKYRERKERAPQVKLGQPKDFAQVELEAKTLEMRHAVLWRISDLVMREIIEFEKEPFTRAGVTVNALFVLGYEVHFGE